MLPVCIALSLKNNLMKKHLSIKVSGLVQGVFSRASTKTRAEQLDISGFVRNERDGSVYIEAEGEESNVDAFVQWVRNGPPRAVVEECEIKEGPVKNSSKFIIER